MRRMLFIVILLLFTVCSVTARADYESGFEAYQKGDFKTAFEQLEPEAKKGNPKAQFALGLLYQGGKGVEMDYAQAYVWYNRAEANGHKQASKNKADLAANMSSAQKEEAKKLSVEDEKYILKNVPLETNQHAKPDNTHKSVKVRDQEEENSVTAVDKKDGTKDITKTDTKHTVVSEKYGVESEQLSAISNDPDTGIKTTITPESTGSTRKTDINGNTKETVLKEESRATPKEPGREYYESVIGGTDWEDLPNSTKTRYAGSERRLRENEELAKLRAEQETKDEKVRQEEREWLEKSHKKLDEKLAAIKKEQEEADKAAAEREARKKGTHELKDIPAGAILRATLDNKTSGPLKLIANIKTAPGAGENARL